MSKLAYALAAAAAAISAAAASSAAATVILDVGPGDVQPQENVFFSNDSLQGPVILGVTNKTGTEARLFGGETLTAFGGGQAGVRSQDLVFDTPFTFNGLANQLLGFDLSDGALTFTASEFRVVGGTATELTLTAVDTAGGVFQQTFAIPPSGFFSLHAIDDQQIDYFSIAANGTLTDIGQVRVGGIGDVVGVIPEPATWAMMLLGFGSAGAMLRMRRRFARA